MQKQEFEERIERTVTDEQYKVIEERSSRYLQTEPISRASEPRREKSLKRTANT